MAELSTLARPYANAAFEYAVAEGALEPWSQALGLLAALCGEEKVAVLLRSPTYAGSERVALLLKLCDSSLSDGMQRFLQVMADNNRLLLLPAVQEQFQVLKANLERTINVDVLTAAPLSEALCARLTEALGKRLGRDVRVAVTIDPTLLGGAVIRAGDLVIDGSLRGRLNKLADALLS
jgi:F-type H+-transporting ATPase subunit delta